VLGELQVRDRVQHHDLIRLRQFPQPRHHAVAQAGGGHRVAQERRPSFVLRLGEDGVETKRGRLGIELGQLAEGRDLDGGVWPDCTSWDASRRSVSPALSSAYSIASLSSALARPWAFCSAARAERSPILPSASAASAEPWPSNAASPLTARPSPR
jgi:hypothetical protein